MVSESEVKELVNKQWLDRRGSVDELLSMLTISQVKTNEKLDSLIDIVGREPPVEEDVGILPGDFGISLSAGIIGNIMSCVIMGKTTNAWPKENISKFTSITVVPGGTPDEPYVVSSSLVVDEPNLAIQPGVKENISTTAVQLSSISIDIYKGITIKVRSLGTGTYIALGNYEEQEFRLTSVGDSCDIDFVSDLVDLYVITDAGSTGSLEWIGA